VIAIGRKKRKMPQVKFNMEAIKEIKKRKKGVCERYLKQSKTERKVS
jgi:hypothetical protein